MFFNLFYITFVVLNFMVMTRIEQLKQVLIPGKTIDFFTADSETIFSIDIEKDIIQYTIVSTMECGCCDEVVEMQDSLSGFLKFMSDEDFLELLKHL